MNVTGVVNYDPNIQPNKPGGNTTIANVPVALQVQGDTSVIGTFTGQGIVTLTDSTGTFTFTNVPAGNYRVVEAGGYPGATQTPGVWGSPGVITVTPNDPDISLVSGTIAGANRLSSVTPNTIYITVGTIDITGLLFNDVPVQENPLAINNYITVGSNLITAADSGTFGSLPNGTPIQTSNPTSSPPYTDFQTDFNYVQFAFDRPTDGEYTIVNTIGNSNFNSWFNFSDHTSFDENGRMMLVNSAATPQTIFSTEVTVTPNTQYVFSAWLMNIDSDVGSQLPQLRIQITNSEVLYNQLITDQLVVTQIPTWNQVGAVFNSGANTSLTVEFISEGGFSAGNDFAIDDISLYQLTDAPIALVLKAASSSIANPGDTITYTVAFDNTSTNRTITDVSFTDIIPSGTTIVPNSLVINNVQADETELVTGVSIPDVAPLEPVIITFKVTVNNNVSNGTILSNTGNVTYTFTDASLESQTLTISSNTVNVGVINSNIPSGNNTVIRKPLIQNYLQISSFDEQFVSPNQAAFLGNVITGFGFTILHHPNKRTVLLRYGRAFFVTYKVIVDCRNLKSRAKIVVGLLVGDAVYPGSVSTQERRGDRCVTLTGSVIIGTDGGLDYVSIVNLSNNTIIFSELSMNIIQLC